RGESGVIDSLLVRSNGDTVIAGAGQDVPHVFASRDVEEMDFAFIGSPDAYSVGHDSAIFGDSHHVDAGVAIGAAARTVDELDVFSMQAGPYIDRALVFLSLAPGEEKVITATDRGAHLVDLEEGCHGGS